MIVTLVTIVLIVTTHNSHTCHTCHHSYFDFRLSSNRFKFWLLFQTRNRFGSTAKANTPLIKRLLANPSTTPLLEASPDTSFPTLSKRITRVLLWLCSFPTLKWINFCMLNAECGPKTSNTTNETGSVLTTLSSISWIRRPPTRLPTV